IRGRSAENIRQHPLATEHGRRPCRMGRDEQNAALSQQTSARIVVAIDDLPEPAALHIWHAIMFGEPLVEERVIRRNKIERAPILLDDAAEEQLSLRAHRIPERFVKDREL